MKNIARTIVNAAATLSLTVALGCGDDDDNGSGVSGSKELSSLSDSEVKKICEWTGDQARSATPSNRDYCEYAGAVATDNEADCNDFVADCLKQIDDVNVDVDESECSGASADDIDASCDVTVSELESCMKASLNAIKNQVASISCKNAGKIDDNLTVDQPAACKDVHAKCPGLLEDIEIDTGSDGGASGGSDTFNCGNGEVIPADFQCDDEEDCSNGKDELGC